MYSKHLFVFISANSGLTQQAVLKHEAMLTYGHSKQKPVDNDLTIAKEFENMSVKTGDEESESEYSGSMKSGTYKTFQTFASDWSQCSNVSFSKYVNILNVCLKKYDLISFKYDM